MTGLINYFKTNKEILVLVLVAILLRLFLSPFGTLSLDQNTFIGWSQRLATAGFSKFYDSWSDYLPGYLYILWFLGKVGSIFSPPSVVLYKLPAILADCLTGVLIYEIVKKIQNQKLALVSSALYLFNPAVLANSTLWGQVDSLTALFSLLAIWLVNINPYLSAVALSVGTLIKPQEAFIAPIIFIIMLKDKWKPFEIARYIGLSLAVFILGFIPFAKGNLPLFIFERLGVTLNQYPYTSVNAFNFWGLFGFWKADYGIQSVLGLVAVGAIFVFACVRFWKEKNFGYFLTATVFISSFLFMTRMHERHLLPAFAPLAIISSINPVLWLTYIGLSFTYLANLFYSFNWITNGFVSVFSPFMVTGLILINLVLFLLFLFPPSITRFIQALRGQPDRKVELPGHRIPPKILKALLVFILAFAFITRTFDLGKPPKEYFDEVYHAFTARQILHGNPKAWEWWNTPPEGFAYEWTHPPFAKEAMVAGMLVFGENSFGWRIPAAILGVGIVFLVYLISKELFKDDLVGVLSAAFFSLDGLALVMSRIGMNDTYFLFFALLSIYLFMKDKNFLSAVALGVSLASKWSAVWAIPILGILWLWQKKKFSLGYLWFLVLPPLVYLASYIPMFLSGHGLDIFWGMQKQMWWYHTRLKATHPYTSPWWSWPIMARPVYLYTSEEVGGFVARIYAIGNPLTFWFGLISVITALTYAFIEKSKKIALVVFAYLIFFVPWAVSPRIMFIYHYLPSIPFMSMAAGYALRRNLGLALVIIGFSLLSFLYFYPHWAGLSVPLWLDQSYYWFPSWR